MCKFKDEIDSAKAEIATWSNQKLSSVQLEGIDTYFQQEKRSSEVENRFKEEELML